MRYLALVLIASALALSTACGGGGSSAATSPTTSVQPASTPITITTASILPATLQDQPYSTTLTATGGTGALHWSITPIDSVHLFPTGLSVDANSGVLSGTANFAGTAGFNAQVTDSSSPAQSITKGFTVTAFGKLTADAVQPKTILEFQSISDPFIQFAIHGGFPPLVFSVTGALPLGVRINSKGYLVGGASATGTFAPVITVRDSFSPPQSVSLPVNLTVTPSSLAVANSIPFTMLLNRTVSGSVVALGGTKPYTFSVSNGSLPLGLSALDPVTGKFSGTPSKAGFFEVTVKVTDSSSPVQTAFTDPTQITVQAPIGRNDTPATATRLTNGFYAASISPYIDPPDGAPFAADGDYYKLVAVPGALVHVQTNTNFITSQSPLDSVIEILDPNGVRLNTCRQPGDTSVNFVSPCLNDDISSTPHNPDSALDFQVPTVNPPSSFLVHILDWRGDARPDMRYGLQISGVVDPLIITGSLSNNLRGVPYSQQLSSSGGAFPIVWSISSGMLPTGFSFSSSGLLSGTATSDGTFPLTVRAVDAAGQVATADFKFEVGEPVKITSSATFPNACVNQPYSFTVQTSGGVDPFLWGFVSNFWIPINLDQATGTFKGTATMTGTFKGRVSVFNLPGSSDFQDVTLNVVQCP